MDYFNYSHLILYTNTYNMRFFEKEYTHYRHNVTMSYETKCMYLDGKMHNTKGPAYILYSTFGKVIRRVWFIHDKIISQELWPDGPRMKYNFKL